MKICNIETIVIQNCSSVPFIKQNAQEISHQFCDSFDENNEITYENISDILRNIFLNLHRKDDTARHLRAPLLQKNPKLLKIINDISMQIIDEIPVEIPIQPTYSWDNIEERSQKVEEIIGMMQKKTIFGLKTKYRIKILNDDKTLQYYINALHDGKECNEYDYTCEENKYCDLNIGRCVEDNNIDLLGTLFSYTDSKNHGRKYIGTKKTIDALRLAEQPVIQVEPVEQVVSVPQIPQPFILPQPQIPQPQIPQPQIPQPQIPQPQIPQSAPAPILVPQPEPVQIAKPIEGEEIIEVIPQQPPSYIVLTEELPNIDEIKLLLYKSVGIMIPTKYTNINIVPNIIQNKFNGKWILSIPEVYIEINLFKGITSSVDYMLFPASTNLETGNAGEALGILESTKTTDKASRNTAVFQRISKFTTYHNMYPESTAKKIMFWTDSNMWGRKLTDTAKFGLRMMVTLDIMLFSYNKNENKYIDLKDKYNIKPFDDKNDMISCKNSINHHRGNQSISLHSEDELIYISIKLDKGEPGTKLSGVISHDPNIGFLASVIHCFEKFNPNSTYIIEKHGIKQEYFDKCPNSKIWYSLKGINVKFSDSIIKRLPKLPDKYFIVEYKMTEKLATILCDLTSQKQNIFSNHSGGALTYIKGIDDCDMSVGRKMARPDIVFADHEKKEILIIEGKIEKDLLLGIKQLSDEHLHGFIRLLMQMYPGYQIEKGICTTISDIRNISNYNHLKYPIKFALDDKGMFKDFR